MFGQTFSAGDLATVAALVLMEGLLSLDNALVLGILAQRVGPGRRMAVLSYGLFGAFVIRLVMIAAAAFLIRWEILELFGGLYLLWIGGKHFLLRSEKDKRKSAALSAENPGDESRGTFWRTVLAIEITDLSFAVDSILAAVALVGPALAGTPVGAIHPKLWAIITGGMLGVVLMRFAAAVFIRLMQHFPRLDRSAYLLVIVIGIKLIVDWGTDFDFLDPAGGAFWVFWLAVIICLALGLNPRKPALPKADV